MSRLRVARAPYAQVARSVAQDASLSFTALGIFAWISSLPDDWDISVERIAKVRREGYAAVKRAVDELIAAQVYHRINVRDPQPGAPVRSVVVVTPTPAAFEEACAAADLDPSRCLPVKPQVASGSPLPGTPESGDPGFRGPRNLGTPREKNLTEEETSSLLAADRPDVDRLCQHLADRIAANGSRRPAIGKAWLDAARLMLDLDQRTEAQVHAAIDWCQADEFWRANVLSMAALRKQYDRLRLAAQRGTGRPERPRSTTDDRVQAGLTLAAELRAEAHRADIHALPGGAA